MAERFIKAESAFEVGAARGQRRPRRKDAAHLAWVATLPCLSTGRSVGVQAAHIRYGDPSYAKRQTGMGEKPSDCFVVPLHFEAHNWGRDSQHANNERDWWKRQGIDPLLVAVKLYALSGDDEAGHMIIREARRGRA